MSQLIFSIPGEHGKGALIKRRVDPHVGDEELSVLDPVVAGVGDAAHRDEGAVDIVVLAGLHLQFPDVFAVDCLNPDALDDGLVGEVDLEYLDLALHPWDLESNSID